jgi:DNA-binding response OmpR family regulator
MTRKKKILLVDDAETILLMEEMFLGKGSYDYVTARDGEQAIKLAEAELPDLILLDVVMPKLNGFEACLRLRSLSATKSIPIIMVTTRGEGTNVERGFESGATDYITKPIDRLELLSKVRSYLGE